MNVQALVQPSHAVEEAIDAFVPEVVHEFFRPPAQILDFLQGAGPFSDDVPVLDQILERPWQLPQEFVLC